MAATPAPTPGPCGCRVEVVWDGDTCSAETCGRGSDGAQTIIRYCPLHATAPDLLAALEALTAAMEDDRRATLGEWARARAATAKATGGRSL